MLVNHAADIALIGLGKLGRGLILNLADHGFKVVAHNRTVERVDEFLRGPAADRPNVVGARSVEEMTSLLARPRKVVLAVTAGSAADELIEQLVPYLEPGDILVDAGNSHFADTSRRTRGLESRGMLFIGAGISPGEDGTRDGPAIMPGGSTEAWPLVRDMFEAIAARSPDGDPCCKWIGEGGAGHFAKMAHNGIEYADMQLICEAYQLLRDGLGLTAHETHRVFTEWNRGELGGYLISATADILAFEDEGGTPLVDKILDTSDQQGTGSWTATSSLELGVPATLIGEAVHARFLSAMKDDRVRAASVLRGPTAAFAGARDGFVEDIGRAVLASRIVSYTQAHMLMRRAAEEHGWDLKYGAIATTWQGGRILRSALLDEVRQAFNGNPELTSLVLNDHFRAVIDRCQTSWRTVVAAAAELGVPTPAISAALAFYDGYRRARGPANLLQAQRDYFGAHTYGRVDRDPGLRFHTDWKDGSRRRPT